MESLDLSKLKKAKIAIYTASFAIPVVVAVLFVVVHIVCIVV